MLFFNFTEEILDEDGLEEGTSLVKRVCSKKGALEQTCRRIDVDFGIIEREESLKINCTTIKRKFEKNGTLFYESADLSSLVLTRNDDLGYPSLHGTFIIVGVGTSSIENCGEDCHIFLEHTEDGFLTADKVSHPEYDYSGLLDDEQLDQEVHLQYI